eukprot:TRINITY_DN1420_c0_g2_i6.p2 TRINITY_DN1420_c0_g2~~TRINITY_DN1420_c0_g2_i6.p2  ORF type:complete len:102 (+),score=10.01 TRINITY_DN1420_c0_g2_i6:565-870(+)
MAPCTSKLRKEMSRAQQFFEEKLGLQTERELRKITNKKALQRRQCFEEKLRLRKENANLDYKLREGYERLQKEKLYNEDKQLQSVQMIPSHNFFEEIRVFR